MTPIELTPIGIVRSSADRTVDNNWSSVIAAIEIAPELASGLAGLEEFSHLVVVFFMHRATFTPATDLRRRPQGRADMPEVGIFAQRAKHRPNPLGVTTVQLLGVNSNVLTVAGLDAVDGTPVLDIKPYFPEFDSRGGARTPEWVGRLMSEYF